MNAPLHTRVVTVNPIAPETDVIGQAAAILRAGGLVAFPTETVYGLGANATDAQAVERIFAAKQRPATDPIIVHIVRAPQLSEVAIDIPAVAHQLAAQFWPGPLTMVLHRSGVIPPNVSAGRDTVAVRMPSHPVAHALIEQAGVPIAAPSANTFSRPSATTAAHVLEDLDGRIDLILDGGAAHIGLESTVIDLTGNIPTILRPGGVTVEAIRGIVPNVEIKTRYLDVESGEAAASPGEMLKHYSPRAHLLLIEGTPDAANTAILAMIAHHLEGNRRVGVLAPDEEMTLFTNSGAAVIGMGSRDDLAQIGLGLFANIRQIDALGVDVILIRSLPREGLGAAIWDRLVRAAEGRIIQA
ncbi:MAG: L-threonylcarbamoyladenylate synthase [Anaerolineae bacterium]